MGRWNSVAAGLSVCKTVDPARFFFSGTSIYTLVQKSRDELTFGCKIEQKLWELTFVFCFFFETRGI